MPNPVAIESPTIATDYLPGEGTIKELSFPGGSTLDLLLDQFKGFRGDNRVVRVTDIPLLSFALIDTHLLGQLIYDVCLL